MRLEFIGNWTYHIATIIISVMEMWVPWLGVSRHSTKFTTVLLWANQRQEFHGFPINCVAFQEETWQWETIMFNWLIIFQMRNSTRDVWSILIGAPVIIPSAAVIPNVLKGPMHFMVLNTCEFVCSRSVLIPQRYFLYTKTCLPVNFTTIPILSPRLNRPHPRYNKHLEEFLVSGGMKIRLRSFLLILNLKPWKRKKTMTFYLKFD
jgi:hypothetical protein